MDKVKTIIAVLKKQYFWALTGLVLLVAGVTWFVATSSLADRFDKRQKKLRGDFSKVQNVCGTQDPPNQRVLDYIGQNHGVLKEKVLEAWKILHKDQKEKNKWSPKLGEEFLTVINALDPDDDIPTEHRELYQNFIDSHFPTLFGPDGIDVVHVEEPEGDGTADKKPARAMEGLGFGKGKKYEGDGKVVGKVVWDENDRERIKEAFEWHTTPTTLQVRLAQEDLWVLEALLRIIKTTNEGATNRFNAVVKQIEAIDVGQNASELLAKSLTNEIVPASQLGDEGSGGMGGEGFGRGGRAGLEMGMMGGGMEGGMGGRENDNSVKSREEQLRDQLLHWRYVTNTGTPLGADEKHPYAEFKMMPVYMRIVMDQRRVPKLLVACANSSMPVEIIRVDIEPGNGARINFSSLDAKTARTGGRSHGGLDETGMGRSGKTHSRKSSARKSGRRSSTHDTMSEESGPFDVTIELLGVIFIYNPPDQHKLGTGTVGEQVVAEAQKNAMPAEQPAAAPPSTAEPAPPTQPDVTPGTATDAAAGTGKPKDNDATKPNNEQ